MYNYSFDTRKQYKTKKLERKSYQEILALPFAVARKREA